MACACHQSRRPKDTIEIFVRSGLTARYFVSALVVKSTDTVYSVMAKVEAITDVPPILQMMTFSGGLLYDDTPGTLADNGIGDQATLHASYCVSGWIRLSQKTLKAQGIDIAVGGDHPADDDGDVEEAAAGATPVQKQQQHGVGKMRVAVADYVIPGPKRTIVLEVEAGDTVASVMEQVQRKRGYPVAMQLLKCDRRRMSPDGSATLADYSVTKDSELVLELHLGFAIAADREERRLNKALN